MTHLLPLLNLVNRIGINLHSLQRINGGSWNMTIDYLNRIKKGMHCKWCDLIKGS